MNFNKHLNLEGQHALLGASKYYWLRYDDNQLSDYFARTTAAQKGTELHSFAAQCIRLKQRLPQSHKTLNMYVNDAIGYRMIPEQILYYSENCFGTTDAISFKRDLLRIHDLKTGVTPAHFEQLEIYAGLFCLEYRIKPEKIGMELRIYQNDDVSVLIPEAEEIQFVMNKIIASDKIVKELKLQEG